VDQPFGHYTPLAYNGHQTGSQGCLHGHHRNYDIHAPGTEVALRRRISRVADSLGSSPRFRPVIMGSGGLRKLRWAAKGKGKRGGSRLIYYWAVTPGQLLLLLIYSKSERDDLTPEQLKTLKMIVEEEYP
jgi:mRNA-degrading endonuclease RelE of RelBE toxin-antitoxin system